MCACVCVCLCAYINFVRSHIIETYCIRPCVRAYIYIYYVYIYIYILYNYIYIRLYSSVHIRMCK